MPNEIAAAAVRGAVEALRADPGYAARASGIADEIASMPDAAAVAAALARRHD